MHGRAAIRTTLLQHLSAHGAELSSRRIRRGTVWTQECPRVHRICTIGRTLRIGTEPPHGRRRHIRDLESAHGCFLRQRNTELLRKFPDNRIVEFRPITLLEHRQGGLLAPQLRCNDALGKLRRTARFLQLLADFWIQIRHRRILWTLFYQLTRVNYQRYQQVYQHINIIINTC